MITLLFSPFLSYLSFGNWDYTVAFMFLSITMLMNQLNSGQLVIIQGSRKLGFLAKANLIGSIIGLFPAGVPGPEGFIGGIKHHEGGIIERVPKFHSGRLLPDEVPALVISSIVAFIISNYFRKKIQIENVKVSNARVYLEGKQMLKMGLVISMSGFISLGFSYIVRLFIAHIGGITELGLYNSGFTIITTYVGLIFTAMGTDYYPRLAGVSDNLIKRNLTINNQSEITMIIIGPIVIIFIVFIKFIVNFLYSKQFIGINDMIVWAAFGMLFKSMSWSIAFLFLAKGDSKFFFRNELFTNLYLTFFNLIGYKYGGLTGLGISFSFSYLIYFLQVYIVTYKKFSFKLNNNLIIIFLIQTIACSIALIIYFNIAGIIQIILNSCIIFISLTSSIIELNKRIKILDYLRNLSS